jgi:copper resistance protein B
MNSIIRMTHKPLAATLFAFALASPVFAQSEPAQDLQQEDHTRHMTATETQPAETQPAEMDHSQHMAPAETQPATADHGAMHHETPGATSLPALRDPHAYSDGYDFGPIPRPMLADEHAFGYLLLDKFEIVNTEDDDQTGAYDLYGWYGRDINRIVIKSEGEGTRHKLHEARTELHWRHALTAFWNTQLGVRYDTGEAKDKGWLAAGMQGLAPYWFEIDVTAYVDDDSRAALQLEVEYELLFTQKLILQPVIEADFYSKADEERATGSGLSHIEAGLRLRYEFTRQFAPYIGVTWSKAFGGTEDYLKAVGEDTSETNAVAGVRFWF